METVSWSRAPMIATPVYLALVLVGLLFILLGDDALSGVFAVILTLPWSAAVTGLMDSAMEVDGAVSGSVGVVVGAAINAAIIYGVVRFVTRRRGAGRA